MRAWSMIAVTVGLSGCASQCTKRPAPEVTTLVFGTTSEPGTIDPAFVRSAGDQEIARLAFLELTELDPEWKVIPRLAAAVPTAETSSAGQTVRWQLREGYGWSDGHPVTTKDVVFGHSIENNASLEVVSHDVARRVAAMDITSDHELTVRWKSPYADFAAPKVHAVLPAHAYPEPTGINFAGLGRATIGNGPYHVAEWKPGQYVRFDRNEHFGGARPAIDRIVFRFFASEDALAAELVTGGIQALGEASGLSLDRARDLEQRLRDTHEIVFTDSGLLLHLVVRLDDPALDDPDVRRGISQAIDRDVIVRLVYGGHARPAFGLFPPRHPAFDPSVPPSEDHETIVKRMGAVKGAELSLQYTGESQAAARAAAYLRDVLQGLGFRVKLIAAPFSVLFERLKKGEHPALTLFALRMRPDWDGAALVTKGGGLNFSGFDDPEVSAAIDRARVTLDPTKWGEALRVVDTRIRDALPIIPLAYRRAVSVRPKSLKGWQPTGTTTPVTWNAEAWQFERIEPRH